MTLQEFKTLHNIAEINLYPSKVAGSNRLVGSAIVSGKETMVMTATGFDSASKDRFIYPVNQTDADGIVTTNYFVSSKEPAKAALVL